jgi:PIN domain nuclease of toxin-antitoxin system
VKAVAVADTHAVLWYLYADTRLSTLARTFIHQASAAGHRIAVSSISLVEVAYLVEKNRIIPTAFEDLVHALSDPEQAFTETPLTMPISDALRRVPRLDIPDMPDRIVAATALHLAVPVISRDGRIHSSTLETIW